MIEGHETEFSAVSKYNPIHFICTDEKGSRIFVCWITWRWGSHAFAHDRATKQVSGECFYLNRWRRYARQAGLDSSRLTTPPEMHNSRYDAFTWKRKSSSASSLPRREPCPEDFIGSHFVEKNSVPWCIWFQIQKYSSRVLALQGLQSFLNISCPTRCGVRCCRIDFNHSHILPDELPSIWLLTS